MRLIQTFAYIFFSIWLFGQQGPTSLQNNLQDVGRANNYQMVYTYNNIGPGTKGSPFLKNEWVKGDVLLKSNQTLEKLDLKLDLFKNELILNKGNSEIYIPKTQIKSFQLQFEEGDMSFIKMEMDKRESVYLQYLVKDQPYSLVKERKITFLEARNEGPYKSASADDEYLMTPKYYLLQGEVIEKIPRAATKFAKLIIGHPSQTKTFIKENHIDLNEEADLIILLQYINQLD